ncbi:hypothetical protein G6M89_20170 [Natronolimnobius sp. AArcel1]|uniref:hypothetical protein n=1 Tax=Natronolimnobius sp. AArcel1 TaxID=1679093 RepID=UPI0013EAF30C|nr:hypothetical protein [Natronolimnobius sp. AArcel1]NGM71286.1 hypothetical protein [Natronolimnobius sp. AArcel1]
MADDKEEAEKLLQQAKEQKRHETEPSKQSSENDVSLEEAVQEAYEQIDNGDVYENLTIRDEDLAALFAGLDETNKLEDIGEAAADALSRDVDGLETRATVLKLLVRVGISEVSPEIIESAKEGRRAYLASQADEF